MLGSKMRCGSRFHPPWTNLRTIEHIGHSIGHSISARTFGVRCGNEDRVAAARREAAESIAVVGALKEEQHALEDDDIALLPLAVSQTPHPTLVLHAKQEEEENTSQRGHTRWRWVGERMEN